MASNSSFRVGALLFWVVGSFYLAQYIVAIGLSWLVAMGYPIQIANKVALMLVISLAMYTIGLLLAVGVPAKVFRWSWRYIRERIGLIGRPQFMHLVVAVIGFAAYFLLSAGLLWIGTLVIPGFNIGQKQELGFDMLESRFDAVVAFVTFVILAPVAEELLFRGFLFGGLRKRMPAGWAALVTSIVFGMIHGQLNVGIDTFALSIILCWLYSQAKTIWPSIFLHMFKNAIAFASLLAISSIQ